MVKSVLGVAHQGLRDWIIQRISALILATYSIGLIAYIILHPEITYTVWHDLFAHSWMKVLTLLAAGALLWHAWIGIWTVFTDYIKIAPLRALLNILVILAEIALFFWVLLILWRV